MHIQLPTAAVYAMAVCALTSSVLGCAQQGPTRGISASSPSKGTLITAEEIAASGASTAWDVVVRNNPRLRLTAQAPARDAAAPSSPSMLPSADCPATTACQVVAVRVVVDGVNVNDLQYLRSLPAEQVHQVEILTGRNAIEAFGPSAAGGVIVVKTKASGTKV